MINPFPVKFTFKATHPRTQQTFLITVHGVLGDTQDEAGRRAIATFVQVFRPADLNDWKFDFHGVEEN